MHFHHSPEARQCHRREAQPLLAASAAQPALGRLVEGASSEAAFRAREVERERMVYLEDNRAVVLLREVSAVREALALQVAVAVVVVRLGEPECDRAGRGPDVAAYPQWEAVKALRSRQALAQQAGVRVAASLQEP